MLNLTVTNNLSGTGVNYTISGAGVIGDITLYADSSPSPTTIVDTFPAINSVTDTQSLPSGGLYYFKASSAAGESNIVACWVGKTNLQHTDLLTQALRSVLTVNVGGLNAALSQLALAEGYTARAITADDIVIGDRKAPDPTRITICILNPSETTTMDGADLGGFNETATRAIRFCLFDKRDNCEEERERVRDTLRSAINWILWDKRYEELTDAEGWKWYACHPTGMDTGEVVKTNEWFWAADITWQAQTNARR